MKNQTTAPKDYDRIEAPSSVPYFALGIFCLVYSMIFPLYLWWHYLIPAAIGGALFWLLRRFIRPRYVTVEAVFEGKRTVSGKRAIKYAAVFVCIMIVFSIIYGGIRSINTYRDTVVKAYREGLAGKSAVSIAETGENLITVANRYIPDDESVKQLKKTLEVSKSNISASAVDNNISAVLNSALSVCDKLSEKILTEDDSAYVVKFRAQFKSDYKVLCGDEYNSKALEYNKTLKIYPAKLFADMAGARELPLFSDNTIKTEEK